MIRLVFPITAAGLVLFLGLTARVAGASFSSTDLGSPKISGRATSTPNGWEVQAGGADIWGTSDQFHFVHQQRTGDFDVMVRVADLTPAHLYTKAGLMAREALTAESRHLFFVVFSDNRPRNKNNGGCELQFREATGGKSQAVYPAVNPGAPPEFPVAFPNCWLRLRRFGNVFSSFVSTDGKNWKLYATRRLELPSTLFVGLALTSHDPIATATARFTDFHDGK